MSDAERLQSSDILTPVMHGTAVQDKKPYALPECGMQACREYAGRVNASE